MGGVEDRGPRGGRGARREKNETEMSEANFNERIERDELEAE